MVPQNLYIYPSNHLTENGHVLDIKHLADGLAIPKHSGSRSNAHKSPSNESHKFSVNSPIPRTISNTSPKGSPVSYSSSRKPVLDRASIMSASSTGSTFSSLERKILRSFSWGSSNKQRSPRSPLESPINETAPIPRAIYSPVNRPIKTFDPIFGWQVDGKSPSFHKSSAFETNPVLRLKTSNADMHGVGSLQSPLLQLNLTGMRCCFCEEDFRNSLASEKPLVLVCGHVTHFECWKQLIVVDMAASSEDIAEMVPPCSTCDEPAIPRASSVISQVFGSILERSAADSSLAQSLETDISMDACSSHTSQTSSMQYGSPIPSSYLMTPQSLSSTGHRDVGRSEPIAHAEESSLRLQNAQNDKGSMLEIHFEESLPSPASIGKIPHSYPMTRDSFQFQSHSQSLREPDKEVKRLSSSTTTKLRLKVIAESQQIKLSNELETYVTAAINLSVDKQYFQRERHHMTDTDLEFNDSVVEKLRHATFEKCRFDIRHSGALRIWGGLRISRDNKNWSDNICYLFGEKIVFVKPYAGGKFVVRGSINLAKHVCHVNKSRTSGNRLILQLDTPEHNLLYIEGHHPSDSIEAWYCALIDSSVTFPLDASSAKIPSSILPNVPSPVLNVFCLALDGRCEEKFRAMRDLTSRILTHMGSLDQTALVLYGLPGGSCVTIGPHRKYWSQWGQVLDQIRGYGSTIADRVSALAEVERLVQSNQEFESLSPTVYYPSDCAKDYNDITQNIRLKTICISAPIDTFGVGRGHCSTGLADLSDVTHGCYTCVRDWQDMVECVMSRVKTNKRRVFNTIELQVSGIEGTSTISCIAGLSRSEKNHNKSFDAHTNAHMLKYLTAGDSRTILVQLCIPPSCVFDEWKVGALNLLYVTASEVRNSSTRRRLSQLLTVETDSEITGSSAKDMSLSHPADLEIPIRPEFDWLKRISSRRSRCLTFVGSQCMDDQSDILEADDQTGTATFDFISNLNEPPSPIYGKLLLGGCSDTPFYLGIESVPEPLAKRRLEIAAAHIFEDIASLLSEGFDPIEIQNSVLQGRGVLQGILSSGCVDQDSPTYVLSQRINLYLDNLSDVNKLAVEQIQLANHAICRLWRGIF